jgi:hypothetical protein
MMGVIRIEVSGSFGVGTQRKSFSAMEHGHAAALAQALGWLTGLLPAAIHLDHQLHDQGDRPSPRRRGSDGAAQAVRDWTR